MSYQADVTGAADHYLLFISIYAVSVTENNLCFVIGCCIAYKLPPFLPFPLLFPFSFPPLTFPPFLSPPLLLPGNRWDGYGHPTVLQRLGRVTS